MNGAAQSAGDEARRSIPAVGPLLGRFRLAARLESAGVPVPGWDTRERRAVSVARLERPLEPEDRRRFARAQRAAHPSLALPLAEGETPLGPVLVTELVTGLPLSLRLSEGPMGAAQARAILRPVAAALDALHDAGLAHGALAPERVFVGEDLHVVLWGLGLPPAPGEGPPSPAGDVLALGRLAARCLSDQEGKGGGAAATALPPAVHAALDPDPAARPRRASAVVAALGAPGRTAGPSSGRARGGGTAAPRGDAGMGGGEAPRGDAGMGGGAISSAGAPAAADADADAVARRSSSRRLLAAFAVLGATLLVAVLLLMGSDRGAPPPVSRIAVPAPAPWHPVAGASSAAALGLAVPVAAARRGALLVAGRVRHPDLLTLLPRRVRARGGPGRSRIGGRVARRWRLARPRGLAFLVPAQRGRPVLLACRAADPALLAACARLAARARVPAVGAPDPEPRLRATLAGIAGAVDAAEARARRRLAVVSAPAARAAAVRRLGHAYARSVARLRRVRATPGARPAVAELARTSRRLARAEDRLAAAVLHPGGPGAAAALREAFAALRATARPTRVLVALGYGSSAPGTGGRSSRSGRTG